jgi:glycosyltransferase involved in cell wall biosynthesis
MRLKALQQMIAVQIDAEGYDVIFVHPCRFGTSPALLQYLKTPSVYYCPEPPRILYEPPIPRPYNRLYKHRKMLNIFDPLPRIYAALYKKIDRESVQASATVLVNSFYSRESLYRTYGIFSKVCYLGVDLECFRPLTLEKQRFYLSVGALGPHKGFDFLLQSLAMLDEKYRMPLVIVTNQIDFREKAYLDDLSKQTGILVDYCTLISDSELTKLYNQATLTLYSPIMEPFGFVPLESMACSTPVVAVREGGVRETVIHGYTGLLVERDPKLFASAVQQLVSNPELMREYGKNGREHVLQNWTWDRSVTELEDYLTSGATQKKQ